MNSFLRHSLSVLLCFGVLSNGCGSRTKANDPMPLVGSLGTGSNVPSTSPVIKPVAPPNPTLTTGPGNGSNLIDNPPISAEPLPNVPVMGTAETLEIGCWNIENYPKSSGSRAMISKILKQMDVDVMALEEVSSSGAFNALLKEMPDFTGSLASESGTQSESQNVGIIYRKTDFTLVSALALFEKETYAFPRPPMLMRLKPVRTDRPEFVVIAVHLKAFGDEESQQRREAANVKLEKYVTDLKKKEPALRVIVVGDFNQPLDETEGRKVFDPWFNKADSYTVMTDILVQKGDYSYYSNTRLSLIDHMISSNDFLLEEPTIPKLHNAVSNYPADATDHLPVITRLAAPTPALAL